MSNRPFATVGAFFLGEYAEAVAVMLLYQIGELFQSYALGKSRKSIAALMDNSICARCSAAMPPTMANGAHSKMMPALRAWPSAPNSSA